MSNGYLDLYKVGSVDCLSLGNIEETSAVISYLKGKAQHVIPYTIFNTPTDLIGVFYGLSSVYSTGYYLTCINTYLGDDGKIFTYAESPPGDMSDWEVPYNGNDSYTFVITDIPFEDLMDDKSLIDTALIKAYGVKFTSGEQQPEPPEIPEGEEWDGGRTFITIRNNTTLEEIAKSYDLMNTRIYEEINNKYTLDFNILPYENVWRIMHPNFLEINGDYFRIRRVEKRRTNSLMMSISCEHISYELNVPYELAMADEETELPEEYPFEGTPTEILTEILQGTRFNIGTVHFSQNVTFTSKAMGFRSMIIGLANEIGAEVKWDKFTVSLLLRRGAIRDLTFEVGKNLLSMTEVYETQSNGSLVRSYDVDVIDLSLIENDGVQEELYDIRLGDTVFLIDEQFAIDVNRRVVSYEVDPFRKELPRIQLGRVGKNITNVINDSSSVPISTGGGGAVEEVVIDLVSYYDTVNSSSDDPNDDSNWVNLRQHHGQRIIFTGTTSLIAGLKLMGIASESATLEGVVKFYYDGLYEDIESSRFKVLVTSGYNTIGIPFFLGHFDQYFIDSNLSLYIQLIVSNGNFSVSENDTTMYVKGKNIKSENIIE